MLLGFIIVVFLYQDAFCFKLPVWSGNQLVTVQAETDGNDLVMSQLNIIII